MKILEISLKHTPSHTLFILQVNLNLVVHLYINIFTTEAGNNTNYSKGDGCQSNHSISCKPLMSVQKRGILLTEDRAGKRSGLR